MRDDDRKDDISPVYFVSRYAVGPSDVEPVSEEAVASFRAFAKIIICKKKIQKPHQT